jgi:hypothetical protein
MHEVETAEVRRLGKQVTRPGGPDVVPPHVRHLGRPVPGIEAEPDGGRVQPAQSGFLPFLACPAEQLHAQANAEDRDSVLEDSSVQRVHVPQRPQLVHRVVERPDTGQDQPVCRQDILRAPRERRRHADLLQHVQDGADVPHAVVNDRHGVIAHGMSPAGLSGRLDPSRSALGDTHRSTQRTSQPLDRS